MSYDCLFIVSLSQIRWIVHLDHKISILLLSPVKCTECLQVSNQFESMMDLNVEIRGDVLSLEDALEQFITLEWMDGENI